MFSSERQPRWPKKRASAAQVPQITPKTAPAKRRKRNCWLEATAQFRNEHQDADKVKTILAAQRDGARLTLLRVCRDAAARTKAAFRRLVAIKLPEKQPKETAATAAQTPTTAATASPTVHRRQFRSRFSLEARGSSIRSHLSPADEVVVAQSCGSSKRLQKGKTYTVAEVGEILLKGEVREARARAAEEQAELSAATSAADAAAAACHAEKASVYFFQYPSILYSVNVFISVVHTCAFCEQCD